MLRRLMLQFSSGNDTSPLVHLRRMPKELHLPEAQAKRFSIAIVGYR